MKKKYRPEIKICGITNLADARAAADAGADYLGFVLYHKSPRSISPRKLCRLLNKIDRKVKKIGVFVNEPAEVIAEIAAASGLDAIQLCGAEPREAFAAFRLPVWRVVRIKNGQVQPALSGWPAARYVIDSAQGKAYGGTGRVADWQIAAQLARSHKIMLAGGLTPGNVAAALRMVKPFGVDVASGVETQPGKKDHDKMRFFIEVIKKACNDV